MTTNEKQVDQAIQTHLAEYSALRDEINHQLSFQNQLINYSIAIIVGTTTLFAIGEPNIASQQPFLLLIASVLLSAISWTFLDASFQVNDLGKYIQHIIAPKLEVLIGSDDYQFKVLQWEGSRIYRSPRIVYKGVVTLGKFAVPYIPSIVFVILFYSFRILLNSIWTNGELFLFWTSIVLVTIPPLGGIFNLIYILDAKSIYTNNQLAKRNSSNKDSSK